MWAWNSAPQPSLVRVPDSSSIFLSHELGRSQALAWLPCGPRGQYLGTWSPAYSLLAGKVLPE